MKKLFFTPLLLTAAAFVFNACSDDKGITEVDYLAVKVEDSDDWGIIDVNSGEYICEDEFENAPSVIYNGVFVMENGDNTYDVYNVDDMKKPVNKESYAEVTDFMDSDVALAVLPGGKINIIDTDCDVVAELPADIATCFHFHYGRAIFKNSKDKYGAIDDNGNVVVEAKYDSYISDYNVDGIAIFVTKKGDKDSDDRSTWTYHAVDKSGDELFTLSGKDYTSIGSFNDGKLPVIKGGKFKFLDKDGQEICSLGSAEEGDHASVFYPFDGKIIFLKDGKYGIKDSEGETLIRAKYNLLLPVFDGKYVAQKDEEWGLIDENDESVISFKYEGLWGLKSNRYLAKRNDEWRIIDEKGETISKDEFSNFSTRSYHSVTSQYIEPKDYAEKIFSDFTTNSCLGYTASTTVGDLVSKGILNHSEYSYKNETTATLNGSDGKTCLALFDGEIASSHYNGYYSYGASFNSNTKLCAVATCYDINRYSIVEDKIAEEFDKLLKSKGYKAIGSNAPNLYKSKDGSVVGVGYEDGVLTLYYYFHEIYTYAPIVRTKRTKTKGADELVGEVSSSSNSFNGAENEALDSVVAAPTAVEEDWGELESPPADDL